MPFSYDPQIEAGLMAIAAGMGEIVQPARGDWKSLREGINTMMMSMRSMAPEFPNVVQTQYQTTAGDGAELSLRWYTRKGVSSSAAVL